MITFSHSPPLGGKMRRIRITKKELVDLAIQSVKQKGNLSWFWEIIQEWRKLGHLSSFPDWRLKQLLEEYEMLIYGRGEKLREYEKGLSNRVSTYELGGGRSGCLDDDPLQKLKTIDISPLRKEIPNYMDIIQPRPKKVYLIEYKLRLIDTFNWQPLFKVVAEFEHRVRIPGQEKPSSRCLYILGKDAHTKHPFALGIPRGFIEHPMEACLRWTMDAHKGDRITEV